MNRWQRVLDLVAIVGARREWEAEVIGPARRAVHDQELASIREHLTSVGLDLNNRDEVLATVVGAESVVAIARAMAEQGEATPIVVTVVDHLAERLVRNLAQLVPAEVDS